MPARASKSVALLGLLCLTAGCDDVDRFSYYYANSGTPARWEAGWSSSDLLLHDVDGRITLPVDVNGTGGFRFLLDSRAPTVWLREADRTESLASLASSRIPTPTGPGVVLPNLRLGLGSVQLRDQTLLMAPGPAPGVPAPPPNVDGVIGYDLLRRFVVEVDRDASLVRVHDPAAWQSVEPDLAIPMVVVGRRSYVDARLTFGDGESAYRRMQLALAHPSAVYLSGTALESAGSGGVIVTLERTDFSAVSSPSVAAATADADWLEDSGAAGALGASFFAHFNVVIDYPGQRLFLHERQKEPLGVRSAAHVP